MDFICFRNIVSRGTETIFVKSKAQPFEIVPRGTICRLQPINIL
jgi:hypothetical protein